MTMMAEGNKDLHKASEESGAIGSSFGSDTSDGSSSCLTLVVAFSPDSASEIAGPPCLTSYAILPPSSAAGARTAP